MTTIKATSYQKHYHAREQSGICVVRRDGEDGEDFIKRFRKKFSKSGLAKEYRQRMFFEKPSDKKRRKIAQSIRLIKRDAEKALRAKERYERIKAKRKKQRDKEKRRGGKYDHSSSRQNSSRISENNKDGNRTDNSTSSK